MTCSCLRRVNGVAPGGGGGACTFTDPTFEWVVTDTAINNANLSWTYGAAITAGDLLVAVCFCGNDDMLIDGEDDRGYPLHGEFLSSQGDYLVVAKVADAGDVAAGSWTVDVDGSAVTTDASLGWLYCFSGASTVLMPRGLKDRANAVSTWTAPDIAAGPGAQNGIVIMACGVDDNVAVTIPGGLTSDGALTSNDTNPVGGGAGHKAVAGGATSGTENFTTVANENGIALSVMVLGELVP